MYAAMAKPVPEQRYIDGEGRRRCMRVALHRGGVARCGTVESGEHVAFVRDFNFSGIFFFSDFEPVVGSVVQIAFSVPDSVSYKRFSGNGKVLRVERMSSGAFGIAAELAHCEMQNEQS